MNRGLNKAPRKSSHLVHTTSVPARRNLVAQKLLTQCDADEDQLVSPEEFCALCRKLPKMAAMTSGPGHQDSLPLQKDKQPKRERMRFFSTSKPATNRSDARLSALQRMLHDDVVASMEATLEEARLAYDDGTRMATYHRGLCDALSACRRILDDEDTLPVSEPGSMEADAFELQQLRRDLAAAKVALAESKSQRDAIAHELTCAKKGIKKR